MTHDPQDPWAIPENNAPDLISINQLDGQRCEQGENPSCRHEAQNGTPPKKLKDFLESTE